MDINTCPEQQDVDLLSKQFTSLTLNRLKLKLDVETTLGVAGTTV